MSISSKAMLVYLTVSGWSARRRDEDASNEVASNHKTDAKRAGNYNKCLIDPKAESHKAVKQAEDAIRKFHYAHTLPWAKNGAQMLPSAEFFEYAAEMQKLEATWREAVDAFVADYPRLKDNARHELNGLYKDADYPCESALRAKFAHRIDYFPVPDQADWRVTLGADHEEDIKANITAQVEEATAQAMRELAVRLLEPVQHMAAKLATPDAIFRDTLVGNVRDICELIPRMNVTGDREIAKLAKEARERLTFTPAQALREDDAARLEKAQEAARIAKKMQAFLGGL